MSIRDEMVAAVASAWGDQIREREGIQPGTDLDDFLIESYIDEMSHSQFLECLSEILSNHGVGSDE